MRVQLESGCTAAPKWLSANTHTHTQIKKWVRCRFFTTLEDYYTEIGFYGQPAFRSCLPRLVQAADNADARVQAPDGFVFPPFVVLDRGMTLGQWLATPRVPSAVVAMATEVLKLLGQLHAGGNVHRDVKPQNLLLTMHSQEWRLLDFGIVARVGAPPRPPLSPFRSCCCCVRQCLGP